MKGLKTGGRKKGTLNKRTVADLEIIGNLLQTYAASGQMAEDFASLEARDRLLIAEKLMQYRHPKKQAIAATGTADTTITIEHKLRDLANGL